jgi:hypothetical protein
MTGITNSRIFWPPVLKKKHWRLGFLLIFSITFHTAISQKHYNFFYGKVCEAGTKRALSGVNLSVEGSRVGTVTDKTGAFSFFIDSIPAILIITHVGFESKTIYLDTTSYSLTLYLNRKVTELQEVEILAKKQETFFKDQHFAVLDYETDSNMVYLLIFRNYLSNAELICKNLTGDTVATSVPFYFRPLRLFKDCLGNLQVLSHDSCYQVFRQGDRLHLIHPVDIKKFDEVLKNCVTATPEILFFQRSTDLGLGVEYYGVNRKTFLKTSVAQVKDEKKTKMLRRNALDAQMLGSRIQPNSREDFVTWNYVHKILYRPVKTSLYRIGDYICVFNTPARQMEFYDLSGNYSYKLALKIDEIRTGHWTGDIMTDETTGKLFTLFNQNGTCHLYEINMNTGSLKMKISIIYPYPDKVKVYNNWVYYLYDVAGDPDNKMLFREKL